MSLVSAMSQRQNDVRSFASAIESRLLAMAHAHQLLAEVDWRPVLLKKLVSSLIDAAKRLAPNGVDADVSGPTIPVSSRRAPALLMILMEWFTNSCKYGACSVAGGKLHVTWEPVNDRSNPGTRARLRLARDGWPPAASAGSAFTGDFACRRLCQAGA